MTACADCTGGRAAASLPGLMLARAAGTYALARTVPAARRARPLLRLGAYEPLRDPRVSECPSFRANERGPAGEVRAEPRWRTHASCAEFRAHQSLHVAGGFA
jgi:hypothetical protein